MQWNLKANLANLAFQLLCASIIMSPAYMLDFWSVIVSHWSSNFTKVKTEL